MGIKYEITAITGEYTNKDGEKKKEYTTIGMVIEKEGRFFIKMKSIPVGWDGFASLYEPRKKEEKPRQEKKESSFSDMDDDIPF